MLSGHPRQRGPCTRPVSDLSPKTLGPAGGPDVRAGRNGLWAPRSQVALASLSRHDALEAGLALFSPAFVSVEEPGLALGGGPFKAASVSPDCRLLTPT